MEFWTTENLKSRITLVLFASLTSVVVAILVVVLLVSWRECFLCLCFTVWSWNLSFENCCSNNYEEYYELVVLVSLKLKIYVIQII